MEAKVEGTLGSISHNGITWLHIEKPTQKEIDFLAHSYNFHHLNLEDCLSKRQLTKVESHEDYIFILLHIPSYYDREGLIVSDQISIFLGKNYLVTLHNGETKQLVDMFQACRDDSGRCTMFMSKSPAHLLYSIMDNLVDNLFPILDKIMNDLDEIEDRVFDEKVSAVREISRLRREIGDIRRIVSPLRRLIMDLATGTQLTARDLSLYFKDVKDHIEKVWETLEEAKETIEIYMDTDYILSAEKTSRVLTVLTIVFTLTIPATVIGTIYGMNISLPGVSWTFLGPYTTFFVILLIVLIPTLVMVWYFRRLSWL
jgi:magnesium transporter